MPMSARSALAVLEALAREHIPAAVAGGWAVDALLRRETREHDDLDLAIDSELVFRALDALRALGLDVSMDQRPARIELRGSGMAVDLHPVSFGPDGVGRQPGLAGEVFEYPAESMEAAGMIGGRTVRCLTPELLVRFHAGYEPRDVDRADMAALAERFQVSLPPAYGAEGSDR